MLICAKCLKSKNEEKMKYNGVRIKYRKAYGQDLCDNCYVPYKSIIKSNNTSINTQLNFRLRTVIPQYSS